MINSWMLLCLFEVLLTITSTSSSTSTSTSVPFLSFDEFFPNLGNERSASEQPSSSLSLASSLQSASLNSSTSSAAPAPAPAPSPYSFFAYRAESTTSKYYYHLLNSNAASEGGVLSYIHTEVIPIDMGSGPPSCTRKWDIDIIVKFKVTVLNPPGHPTPPNGDFMAFDGGKCTVPGCQDRFDREGYFVGTQLQTGNPRHRYDNAIWYSFPAGGLCNVPDGTSNCTYSAVPVGAMKVDDFINAYKPEILPNYHSWCKQSPPKIEFNRKPPPDYCQIVESIEFWQGVCDEKLCTQRTDQLKLHSDKLINTTLENGCKGDGSPFKQADGTCVTVCPLGTSPNWQYVCSTCMVENCERCSWQQSPDGKSGEFCKKCFGEIPDVKQNSCDKGCPAHTYRSGKECLQCNQNCGNCTGPASNQCTSCGDTLPWLDKGTCVSDCGSHRFHDDAKTCQTCDPACGDCTGPGPNSCSTCPQTGTPFLENTTCVVECFSHHYPDGARICQTCSADCGKCWGPNSNQCLSCPFPNKPYLDDGVCVAKCGARKYPDASGKCGLCATPCQECTGPTDHECTSCVDPNAFLTKEGKCTQQCPTHTFPNKTNRRCDQCAASCLNCTSAAATTCTSCSKPLPFLLNGTCLEHCPTHYFPENASSCKMCNPTCRTCEKSAQHCTSCDPAGRQPFLDIENAKCVDKCPSHHFPDKERICQACDKTCGECSAAGAKHCTKCNPDSQLPLLYNSTCLSACPAHAFQPDKSSCADCSGDCASCAARANNCTACFDRLPFLDPSQGKCLTTCPTHTYPDNKNVCAQCFRTCQECKSGTEDSCTSCIPGYLKELGRCVDKCDAQFYPDPTTPECKPCDPTCYLCSGPSNKECTKCPDQGPIYFDRGTCVNVCPDKSYPDNDKKCQACSILCAKCNGPSNQNCTACATPDWDLVNKTCIPHCKPDEFRKIDGGCVKCPLTCATCTALDRCTSCASTSPILYQGACLSECPSGTQYVAGSSTCEAKQSQTMMWWLIGAGCAFICIPTLWFGSKKIRAGRGMMATQSRIRKKSKTEPIRRPFVA